MQLRFLIASIWCIGFLIPITNAQLPFHYFVDYTGKVKTIQIDGKPYEMFFFRQNDPLANLKEEDTVAQVIRKEYTFDNGFEKLRTIASNIDTLFRDGHDFSNNIPINRNYFTQAYPFWQDYDNPLIAIPVQKGKYYYQHTYLHYTPGRSTSMPPPGPAGSTAETYSYFTSKWHMDSNYRIIDIVLQRRDSNSSRIDSTLYRYEYTAEGLIKRVTHHSFSPIPNGSIKDEVFIFYTPFNKPKYVLCISKRAKEIDEEYCMLLLDTMKKAGNMNDYIHYRDSPLISYFTAYNYDAQKRFSSCFNFDKSEGQLHLTVDSITYNKSNLPDTIDQYAYKSKDQYGSRTIFIYNAQGKLSGTIENSSRQWFRNFKSEVAYPKRATFLYDKKGRIKSVTTFFSKHPDVEYRYDYVQ